MQFVQNTKGDAGPTERGDPMKSGRADSIWQMMEVTNLKAGAGTCSSLEEELSCGPGAAGEINSTSLGNDSLEMPKIWGS